MDKTAIVVINFCLFIGIINSAPQFSQNELAQQQNSLYPNYFYQQLPFIYNPYPNPFYMFNYMNTFPTTFSNTKSESNTKILESNDSEKTESKVAEKSSKSDHLGEINLESQSSVPYVPLLQYDPNYGRNLDSWTAKEIPVTVIVDEMFHKTYNVPFSPITNSNIRTLTENEKTNSLLKNSGENTVSTKINGNEARFLKTESISGKNQVIEGLPPIGNLAVISTPQASVSFYPYFQASPYGRDLNVQDIPITAIVEEETNDQNLKKDVEKEEEKVSTRSPVISSN